MGREEVATWKRCRNIGEAPGGRDLAWELGKRNGVATPFGGRDLEWPERCPDTNFMSRHGLAFRRSRPGNDVATWHGAGQGREVATCARDMRATSRLCAQQRPRPGHCARSVSSTWVLGVRTMHPTQFCFSALFAVTVWVTVHGHCS